MGDKLCLQLCGFEIVCCIIEKSEHSKHQNFLCICFIARFSIFGIYLFFNKLFQSWVSCHILFTIYYLALISKWTKNTALWNTIKNPFKIFDSLTGNCIDGKLFKASFGFLQHFFLNYAMTSVLCNIWKHHFGTMGNIAASIFLLHIWNYKSMLKFPARIQDVLFTKTNNLGTNNCYTASLCQAASLNFYMSLCVVLWCFVIATLWRSVFDAFRSSLLFRLAGVILS